MPIRLPRDWSRWCDYVRDKTRFYIRDIRQWSDVDQIHFDAWLRNFPDDVGHFLALKLINRFIYYSERDVRRLLQHGLSKVFLYPQFLHWARSLSFDTRRADTLTKAGDFLLRVKFAPLLDDDKPSESGNQLCRYLSHDFGVPELQLYQPSSLDALSDCDLVILDDFIGTGEQAIDFWNQPKLRGWSLKSLALDHRLRVTYLALVATRYGLHRIATLAPGLHVLASEVLEDTYRVFNEPSLFFGSTHEVEASKEHLRDLCGNHAIPLTGFHGLDYAVAFHHGTPDATLPLFWWNKSPSWQPLLRR